MVVSSLKSPVIVLQYPPIYAIMWWYPESQNLQLIQPITS